MNCAIAIAKAVKNRPDLEMRMGIHCGDVCPLEDINGNLNIEVADKKLDAYLKAINRPSN